MKDFFEKLSNPACRALAELRIKKIQDFGKFTKNEISSMHGMGPSSMKIIEPEMAAQGITFIAQTSPLIDEYIAGFPLAVRKKLSEIRKIILKAAPNAYEKISYGMPTFYQNGNLVHFAAFKNHIGFYPTPTGITTFNKELKKYQTSKGAAQFPLDQELPVELIRKIVKFRVKENREK